MEKAKKELKIYSIVMLVLVGCSILLAVFQLAPLASEAELAKIAIETETSVKMVRATLIGMAVFGLLFMLPDIYLAVRGIKVSKGAAVTGAQIVWAKILFVFAAIGFIVTVVDLFNAKDLWTAIISAVDAFASVMIYFYYTKLVKKLKD